jgi:protein farnesyltransferase/geranylgeranyltransferase type-1 subunit alpha
MNFASPEWSDVQPVPFQELDTSLVPIQYEATYKECMSYLLPLLKNQEFSKRALELTGEILSQNASHYSVW